MEARQLADLLPALQNVAKQQSDGSQTVHKDAVIIRFFSRMTHLFGHKWTSVYGDAVADHALTSSAKHWAHDLSRLSVDDIGRGLDAMMQLRLEWSPSPIEFIAICEKARPLAWHKTSIGIEAKGAEIGLKPEQFKHWPEFKNAVFEKCGGALVKA